MTTTEHTPASWFELNSWGVLIAVIELVVGTSGLTTPERLTSTFGTIPATAPIWLGGYIAAGFLLLVGLWRARTDIEAYSIILVVAANTLQLATAVTLLGAGGIARDSIISVALIATAVMRLRALMRGGTFTVPRWHRNR